MPVQPCYNNLYIFVTIITLYKFSLVKNAWTGQMKNGQMLKLLSLQSTQCLCVVSCNWQHLVLFLFVFPILVSLRLLSSYACTCCFYQITHRWLKQWLWKCDFLCDLLNINSFKKKNFESMLSYCLFVEIFWGISTIFSALCFLYFSFSACLHNFYSFLFLQLHHAVWGAAVSQLPSRVRKQYALRVADHHQPREPNQSGLQRSQHGEAV